MSAERTESPTPRRLREARRRGQVARSADLVSAVCLAVGGAALLALGGRTAAALLAFGRQMWRHASAPRGAEAALGEALATAARAALPLVGLLALTGIAATLVQTGPVLAPAALRPDLSRLSPAAGLRRLFSAERLAMPLKAAAALAAAGWVARHVLAARADDVLRLVDLPAAIQAAVMGRTLLELLLRAGALLLALGAVDLLLARRGLHRRLRMTRDEVRREHKDQEGDPTHRGRRRQAHRELAAAPVRPLKEAAVVVLNPTHVAVALHWGEGSETPEVGVRGVDEAAARIRAEARRLGLPLVRDVALARALLAVDPGQAVPEPLYDAVAAVLAAVYRARAGRVGAP